jgi:hypothetical protein
VLASGETEVRRTLNLEHGTLNDHVKALDPIARLLSTVCNAKSSMMQAICGHAHWDQFHVFGIPKTWKYVLVNGGD